MEAFEHMTGRGKILEEASARIIKLLQGKKHLVLDAKEIQQNLQENDEEDLGPIPLDNLRMIRWGQTKDALRFLC